MCWYVAYSRPRSEFKASDYFNKCGINSYVPSYIENKQWSDRIKKTLVTAISGYVFFETNKLDYSLINTNPFLRNVLRKNGKPLTIRQEEIQALKEALNGFSVSKEIKPGDDIKILSGAFKNMSGLVDFVDNKSLSVLINSIKITLSLSDTRLRAMV
jgi:transcription antitermination factor NusG